MGLRQLDYLQVPFMGNAQSQKKIFPAETSKPAGNKRGGGGNGLRSPKYQFIRAHPRVHPHTITGEFLNDVAKQSIDR